MINKKKDSRKKRAMLSHMYRAAIARTLFTTLWDNDDPLKECLEEALAVRDTEDAQKWFDKWPKDD